MVMKLITPEINPKKSMVVTAVDFEVHSEMNTFNNDVVQHALEGNNEDKQGHSVCVYYAAQDVHSESENETDDNEDNDEKYQPTREQKSVDSNLIDKLADLKICVSKDAVEKTVSASSTQELKIKEEDSSASEETKQNASGTDKTEQPVILKDEKDEEVKEKQNNNNYDDNKDDKSVKVNDIDKNNEEESKELNITQPKTNMNIPLDEVVDGIDNLKLIKQEDDDKDGDEEISRGPEKGHQNIGNYRAHTQPYSRFTSHGLQTGGCIIAQVCASQTNDIQPSTLLDNTPLERSISPVLDENHYLSDEAEKFILDLLYGDNREQKETQNLPISKEVSYTNPQMVNKVFSSWESQPFESSEDRSNSSCNFQCLSPPVSDYPRDEFMFSPPPQYRQYAQSLSTGTPSPLSSSTDASSICYSPSSSTSPDSPVDASESMLSLNISLPSTSPDIHSNSSYCSSSTPPDNVIWPNKTVPFNFPPRVVTGDKINLKNINDEVLRTTSINLPAIRQEPEVSKTESRMAIDRIRRNPEENREAFRTLALISDEELSAPDPDGDTKLLIMIAQKLPKGFEYLYALVNRLKKIPGALAARNAQNHSALLLACIYMRDQPLVARFIAEALQSVNHDLNEVYDNGNTIIHWLCERGDGYLNILVELLSMRDEADLPCFDINKHNHSTGTPLLVAVKAHGQVNCSKTITFLLSQGASVTETERCGGQTSLHIAIKESGDPLIVQILLKAADRQGRNLVNCMDYPRDTALHYAHLRNDIPVQQQLRIIQLLLQYGANNVTGSQGRMPLALVTPAERKEFIRTNTQRRHRKP